MKVFQPFRLDTVNHCLWRAEERVRLTPRAFDVLRYLVEHAERLVTQDEILEALWPETYVNPEVIKQYIRGIRKALGDDPEKPSYIETFPRRGYQFIAPECRSLRLGGVPRDRPGSRAFAQSRQGSGNAPKRIVLQGRTSKAGEVSREICSDRALQ